MKNGTGVGLRRRKRGEGNDGVDDEYGQEK